MGKDHLAFMIRESVRAHGPKTAMRYKEGGVWRSITYAELGERIRAVAKALLDSGVQEGDMVGIFARNAPEWAIADFAVLSAKAVSVPIYATNTTSQAEYIATDAGLKLIFVGDQVQYDKVMSFQAGTSPSRSVIAFDRTTKQTSYFVVFSCSTTFPCASLTVFSLVSVLCFFAWRPFTAVDDRFFVSVFPSALFSVSTVAFSW
jgi:long-chain acyl-CoA synthetase